jgi:hypothetical protein
MARVYICWLFVRLLGLGFFARGYGLGENEGHEIVLAVVYVLLVGMGLVFCSG